MQRPLMVIVTHDVDWPPAGPGVDHVLARRERFDDSVISMVTKEGFNPYNCIFELMDIEEAVGIKSTFFFRPRYDDGTLVDAYQDTIRALVKGGWEIGVHINDASTFESIKEEKRAVETPAGKTLGSRVHYLKVNDPSLLEAAGFAYDSSFMYSRNGIDVRNTGFFNWGKLIVFPITIMDAYLFSYMRVREENVVATVDKAADVAGEKGFMTILWHDCSIKMKGGRMYPKVLEALSSRENTKLMRGIDAYNLILRGDES
jgi:peptidoglycan/xylan/chitin deacetylase (PgdA/CDA1 family)